MTKVKTMILKNCEIWYAKVNPARPNPRFDKANPRWEAQIRTTDKAQRKEWEAAGLKVKSMVPDEGAPYFYVNLQKKSVKSNGEAGAAPSLVDAKLNDVNPDTIGNGSIANVRVFQYENTRDDGTKQLVSILMGLQLIHHIVYTPKERPDDEFQAQAADTTVVAQEEAADADPEDFQAVNAPAGAPASAPARNIPAPNTDVDPDNVF